MINRASVAPNIKKKVTSPFKTTVKYCDHLSFIFHSDAEATAAGTSERTGGSIALSSVLLLLFSSV